MEPVEGVEGGGMLAEVQQTCPILMTDHGPLTARKQRDYLNRDNLGVQFTHLNTLRRKQTSVKCYWKAWHPILQLIAKLATGNLFDHPCFVRDTESLYNSFELSH